MWIEYSIPADHEMQKRIIRHLRTWIEGIDEKGIVNGFAFNHYSGQTGVQDDLRVRFDYPNEINTDVETELRNRVREFVPDYSPHGRSWESNQEILKGYEFGSRCAFLFWEMVEKDRFSENFLADYVRWTDQAHYEITFPSTPFNFQSHFYHGVMNSLGVRKQPNELSLHLLAIIESMHFHSQEELFAWIRTQPQAFFRLYP